MITISRRIRYFFAPLLLTTQLLHADWKQNVGYDRLVATFTTGVPTAVSAGVTQAEASNSAGNNYLPASSTFTDKTINNLSSGTGTSGHANTVGGYYYSNTNSLIPNTLAIDAYNANTWLYEDFLNFNSASAPLVETRSVQNHSWISIFSRVNNTEETIASAVANINLRIDYAIERDGFTSVVGVNNGSSTTLPDLLCQSYHTISVGRVDGAHSHGLTAYDIAGRMKPDLVSFETLTSYATPQVASAAGLISEKIRNTYASGLLTPDYPRLTKAILLAGAAKEPLSSWSRADTSKPYDATSGAGALNILLAYRILSAGGSTYSANSTVPSTGWSVASANSTPPSQSTRTYFFDLPAGATNTPFSAALTWHRVNDTLANLDLRLYSVASGTFTLGTQIDASISTVDNVEHIYRPDLAPGRYALQVTLTSGASTPYALAWRTSPTVTVVATDATAAELDGTTATFNLSRTGPTTSPLLVPLIWSGTGVSGSHYNTPPDTLLIPAGQSSASVTITPIADDLAQGDRTVTLTIATDYSLSAGAVDTATSTIEDKPFDAWRYAHFSPAQLADPLIVGATADPDADHLNNLLEYALDAAPLTPDAATHAPTVALDGDRLALTYLEATGRTDLTYTVETTEDLGDDWQTGPTFLEETARTNVSGGQQVTVRRIDTAGRQFLRLRVTR